MSELFAAGRGEVLWDAYGDKPEAPFHGVDDCGVHAVSFEMRGYRFRAWEQVGLPKLVRKSE
ncbi:MAG: hypothetical protein KDA51_16020, partial [Planctomycetales bacterium]|nr:hypothetical protein [Planctomycetales bacterium]